MPWFHFTADYDHRWPSGAVTAFLEGMKLHVKKEVADAASEAGAGKETSKPSKKDEGYRPTPSREESKRVGLMRVRTVKSGISGNPVPDGRVQAVTNLPDPSDPRALRSEPLVEHDRARIAGVEEEQVEDLESESQIDANADGADTATE